ncbi:MAG: hypothetical protein GY861_13900 [bacterium]|nr:hypothetical protein [bacterium]
MKLTSKQERFCREIAKGTNQYQSFCIAYPLQGKNSKRETLDVHASQLANSDKIKIRVAKLQESALTHVKYDIEAHFKELEEAKKYSMLPRGKYGDMDVQALLKAVELKGKVKGHYIARTENVDVKLTDAEAESKLRDYADKLGITWEEYCARMGIVR